MSDCEEGVVTGQCGTLLTTSIGGEMHLKLLVLPPPFTDSRGECVKRPSALAKATSMTCASLALGAIENGIALGLQRMAV